MVAFLRTNFPIKYPKIKKITVNGYFFIIILGILLLLR